ncbi:MAG TPA: histidinol-phosphate transaminase [Stellaceae bacterium]|nr:histidinol-phosphate transaminase [Stellaceae bacterium]
MATAPSPRPGVLDISPYVGGEAKIEGVARVIRLASNESALGPSPKALAAYRAAAGEMFRYPDGHSTALRQALGKHYGLDPARIVCGAGSDELIGLLIRAYAGPGDEVVYGEHGFLMYPIDALAAGATPVKAAETDLTFDVDQALKRVTPRTKLVFVANPNNPTGTYVPRDAMRRLQAGLPPSVLLVIDAAYAEFVQRNDYEPGIELVDEFPNVVMARTFSKIYAMGGLRLGWVYCSPAVADVLNRTRPPFNVNSAAQAAGIAALDDMASFDRAREHNDIWRPWLERQLRALGLALTPSVANFVLVHFPPPPRDARAAFEFLRARGILTRRVAAYGLPEHLRITIGLEDEMRAVAAAVADFMGAR